MSSLFQETPFEAQDAVFELKAAYDRDTDSRKINLGPGAYLDGHGKPWVLTAVAAAEEEMRRAPGGHEYLPILGLPAFRAGARKIAFGADSRLLSGPNVATIQTVSGTGAVRIAIQAIKLFYDPKATVYVSDPSWSNHRVMFEYAGFEVKDYPYYDDKNRRIAFDKLVESLESAKSGSVFVLHACAHNPTGYDLTHDQWRTISKILKRRELIPVVDNAYQGFASGDLERDSWSVRHIFEEVGLRGLLCQSFSKSMGLYGERVGALHVVLPDNQSPELLQNIESQIGWISRKELSTPPRYGATIASTVISNEKIYKLWREDLVTMSTRLGSMREAIVSGLTKLGTPGTWDHVTAQIGMFSYTGLSPAQVDKLKEKHIYLAQSGRISLSGLNESNVEYFCKSVDEVVRGSA